MIPVSAHQYIELGRKLRDATTILILTQSHEGSPGRALTELEQDTLRTYLHEASKIAYILNMPVCTNLISNRIADLPRTPREIQLLIDMVMAEIQTKLFLYVPPHVAKYYELTLPSIVTVAFPSASKELVSSGNALAAGISTASVFHSMRAAEIGVRALGLALGVSFPNHPVELAEWQQILEQAQSKINAMKALPRGTHKDEELQFCSESAVQFWYFKDAWRIRVAHARSTYDESEAIKIFDHTFSFFQTLATRLKEPT